MMVKEINSLPCWEKKKHLPPLKPASQNKAGRSASVCFQNLVLLDLFQFSLFQKMRRDYRYRLPIAAGIQILYTGQIPLFKQSSDIHISFRGFLNHLPVAIYSEG